MNNLDKHRKEIDKIDDNIIELLEQRFNLVVEIGQYKKKTICLCLTQKENQQSNKNLQLKNIKIVYQTYTIQY